MLAKLLSPAQDELLREERQAPGPPAGRPGPLRRRGRPPGRPRPLHRAARRAVPAGGRRRVQLPARAPSSTPWSANVAAGRRDAHDRRRSTCCSTARPQIAPGQGQRAARHHRAGAHPPRHPHRRHPGHQRHHPGARADHRASSSPGPTWSCSSRRPTVRSPRPSGRFSSRSAAGARRSSSSSTRSTSSSAAEVDEVRAFVADECARPARVQPRDLPGERPAGAEGEAGRAGRVGGEPLRGARALHRAPPSTRRAGFISSC